MKMDCLRDRTRRQLFQHTGVGLGRLALAGLLTGHASRGASSAMRQHGTIAPHVAARAKRVIYLFMAGAPSQLDLFDYKPRLSEFAGQSIPPSVIQGQRYAFIQPNAAVLSPQFSFAQHGNCGAQLSAALPHLSQIVDEIAIVRSVHTDVFNHAPAQLFCNTGSGIPGRPSMGSWLSYGIGSATRDLPAFVVLKSGGSLSGGAALWGAGPLPATHQGVPFRNQGDPILHISNPPGYDSLAQRDSLDVIRQLNQERLRVTSDPEITARIEAYEMAYRMQSRAPELLDLKGESATTLALYGAEPGKPGAAFANNVLLARRLAERGVRFIQVYHSGWDHHSNVKGGVARQCQQTDRASAALIHDLKQRGLLDDTLVVWGGEFGRTPMVEASAALGRRLGRDHHPQAFSMWFAGGGIRGGVTLGQTDAFGFHPVDRPVHVHEVQATILHCLGIDHSRLTFPYRGLNLRLTGVEPQHPIREILA
ncbi:MAG: DUF1501 domain-containing protein [Planctomycetaceae bacterium]